MDKNSHAELYKFLALVVATTATTAAVLELIHHLIFRA